MVSLGGDRADCGFLEEKQDVIAMLQDVAGASAERFGPIREGLGRLSSSLLHG
jgi:hypothetical protein